MATKKYGFSFRILSGSDIQDAINDHYLRITPFQNTRVQPTSYDISIAHVIKYLPDIQGDEGLLACNKIDFSSLELGPSQSIQFLSEEAFFFPQDMFADIYLRSRYSRILNCGGHLGRIECGWCGRLIIEISNQSLNRSFVFTKGLAVASLVIYQLDSNPAMNYSGLFQKFNL